MLISELQDSVTKLALTDPAGSEYRRVAHLMKNPIWTAEQGIDMKILGPSIEIATGQLRGILLRIKTFSNSNSVIPAGIVCSGWGFMQLLYKQSPKFPMHTELEFDVRGRISHVANHCTIDIGEIKSSSAGNYLLYLILIRFCQGSLMQNSSLYFD